MSNHGNHQPDQSWCVELSKAFIVNPCDSCNTDVHTPLNANMVHVYSNYAISFGCAYIVNLLACITNYVNTQDLLMMSLNLQHMRKCLVTST